MIRIRAAAGCSHRVGLTVLARMSNKFGNNNLVQTIYLQMLKCHMGQVPHLHAPTHVPHDYSLLDHRHHGLYLLKTSHRLFR